MHTSQDHKYELTQRKIKIIKLQIQDFVKGAFLQREMIQKKVEKQQ